MYRFHRILGVGSQFIQYNWKYSWKHINKSLYVLPLLTIQPIWRSTNIGKIYSRDTAGHIANITYTQYTNNNIIITIILLVDDNQLINNILNELLIETIRQPIKLQTTMELEDIRSTSNYVDSITSSYNDITHQKKRNIIKIETSDHNQLMTIKLNEQQIVYTNSTLVINALTNKLSEYATNIG